MLHAAHRIAFVLLVVPTGTASSIAPAWRLFRSSTGVVVRYPASWVRFGISRDQLDLLSSPGGREGIIIKPGQALLSVAEPQDTPTRTLAGVIAHFTKDVDSVTTRRDLPIEAASGGCQKLREVVSWEPLVPRAGMLVRPPDVIDTQYFCEVGARIVVTTVRNYADDPRTPEYRAVGLQVARSIRIVPSSRRGH